MAIGFRGVGVITFTTHDRMVPHGWLTPAAPGARRRSAEKATFAVLERTFTRAAGVSPPGFGNVTFLQICDADRQPHPCVQLGAATVSPPWYAKPTPPRENRALFSN
jgi:hypothetical protein